MSDVSIQALPGFRELYPKDCAVRNYLFQTWREVAARAGFAEWEAPLLEPTELYIRKSGEEIVQQLFCFADKGGREVSLRPELTPSLARMASLRQRDFKKPMKWFEIGACFRYESPSRGRLREFNQWNCDLLGETGLEAEAELIALAIASMRALGFTAADFAVRLSDRRLWNDFLAAEKLEAAKTTEFLQIIDKWEREPEARLGPRLEALGTSYAAVQKFMANDAAAAPSLAPLLASLDARGLREFIRIDPTIVRGLAYYTGVVFEVFSLKTDLRAVAGGGRYDALCGQMTGQDLAAAGFAMGDVVITHLIAATPVAQARLDAWLAAQTGLDAYVVVADEAQRPAALALVEELRAAGLRTDFSFGAAKVGKQFQAAEALTARTAVIVGSEYPTVKVKDLAARSESAVPVGDVATAVRGVVG